PYTRHSEVILPDGDLYVILLASRNTMLAGFRVSSQICRVASATFAKLIDAECSMQDACKVIFFHLSPRQPRIHSRALRCILSVLHHTSIDQYKTLDVRELLGVSETSVYLECNNALAPWIGIWCPRALHTIIDSGKPSVVDVGMLLKSVDNFEAKDELAKLRQYAVCNLSLRFQDIWAEKLPLINSHECKSFDGLKVDINNRLVRAFAHIWSLEGPLSTHSEGYLTAKRLCLSCGRQHPSDAKLCHSCRNWTLHNDVCTKSSRIGEYFKLLARQTLWPFNIMGQEDTTLSAIAQRVNGLTRNKPHSCSGGLECPLIVHLHALQGHLKRIVDDCAWSSTSETQQRQEHVIKPDIRNISTVEGGGAMAEVVVKDLDED
ncbi:hypothetical protein BDP55DRAFT_543894, partial [Colletotrichum godetiae]